MSSTDDLTRSRLTVFFRLLLIIPHLVWLYIWGIAVSIVVFIAWIAALFTGRVPAGMHGFIASFMRYATRVFGYGLLLANPYPPFGGSGDYPIELDVAPPVVQNRWTVFFRLILAIPALFLTSVFRSVNGVIAFLGWFYCLFTGRMSQGMRNLSAWLLRYEMQTYSYMNLLTPRYPSLEGAPAA
jgi:hypothetical protein